jgi:hypothetical protein
VKIIVVCLAGCLALAAQTAEEREAKLRAELEAAQKRAQEWPNVGRYRADYATVKPGSHTVVFMGDSITDGWGRRTASENDPEHAWLCNFGRGGLSLNRHSDGEKQRAYSVRCVRE